MKTKDVLFYCGRGNSVLAKELILKLSEYLGTPLSYSFIDFGVWRDSCPNDRIIDYSEVKSKVIIFVASLFSKEDLFNYLSLSFAFKKQYGAKRLIAVNPFNLLRRCDHDEKEWEIQYLRQYIGMMSYMGIDDLVVCTPHSSAFQDYCKEFSIRFHPVYMDFSADLKTVVPREEKIVVYSPDEGSIPRAIAHSRKIKGSIVMFDLKNRKENSETEILEAEDSLVSKTISLYSQEFDFDDLHYFDAKLISGANVIMIDDEMSSGGTANSTAHKLKNMGAKSVFFAFTHPVCVNGWKQTLFYNNPFARVLAGNTIPRGEFDRTGGKIIDVSVAQVIASALYKILD